MDLSNVSWTAGLTVWIAGVLLLMPVAAVSARIGLKPVLDAVARLRAAGRGEAGLEARFDTLEEQLRGLSGAVERLAVALERRQAAER